MAHGLLVSDHAIINDIYSFNLKAYVDLGVTVKDSLEDALKVIELGAAGEIIICLSQMGEVDAGFAIVTKVEELGLDIPIIVIGEKSSVSNTAKAYTLPPNFNIPVLVKTIAKILGITAKDMMEKSIPDFYPVPMSIVDTFEVAPCHLYLKVSKGSANSDYVLCVEKEGSLSGKGDRYRSEGFHNLYIPSDLRLEIVNKASKVVMAKLNDPLIQGQDRLKASEQGYDVVGGLLGESSEVTPEVVAISKRCVESVKAVIGEVPKVKILLLGMLENKTGYLYLHSVMGTYVSRHIIREISWGSDEHAEKLSFVFFFHDIFLSPIFAKYPHFQFEEDLVFKDDLGDKEKEVVINHARLAAEMVKSFPRCPMGADAIILQHHGTTNGMGFTLDYKDDISPLAKVLIVSEAFVDQLILARDSGAEPVLEDMIAELRTRFRKHTYKKIINCLETISF